MNINKIIVYITVLVCLLMIGVPTLYKIVKENEQNLYLVSEKKITEAAYKCYYEGKCAKNTVTLEELYQKGYLVNEEIDPITKEVYSKDSYVVINKDKISFYKN